MQATASKHKSSARRREGKRGKPDELNPPRSGICWDRHAEQWAILIGYQWNHQVRRMREIIQRLGRDTDSATIKRAKLKKR